MAHWIIEDKGFGGTDYQCSECGNIWNDLFYKGSLSMAERCPGCEASFNEDEIEYVEQTKNDEQPMYYYEDAIEFIRSRSDLSEDVISKVLELELEYMKSIGLIYEI